MTLFTRRQLLMTAAFVSPLSRLRAAEPVWQAKLESIRVKYELPALGAAIVISAGLQSQAVCGVRKLGTEVAVTVDDLWHLGSNTKAFTATLAAMAVQAGKLRWESTLEEIFPDQEDLKKVPLAKATLTQLLSHWSGLPANPQWGMIMLSGQDLRAQREIALQMAARTADLPEPGAAHLYSNWGYVLAGHMLEQVWDAPHRQHWADRSTLAPWQGWRAHAKQRACGG
ncbi:MAG: serine hydrolase [Verrucomicrobia bacterium]|nr:serine hydrolase [Verrucomicrobiota bacterium]